MEVRTSTTSCANEKTNVQVIYAETLIPGKGEPSSNQAVIIEHGKIIDISGWDEVPQKYRDAPSTTVPYLLPGLWDCRYP